MVPRGGKFGRKGWWKLDGYLSLWSEQNYRENGCSSPKEGERMKKSRDLLPGIYTASGKRPRGNEIRR